jgi:hypothetical protein
MLRPQTGNPEAAPMTDHPTRRNTLRLRDFDYRNLGYYFVTIGTYQHLPIFGEVRNARMHLNPLGERVMVVMVGCNVLRPYGYYG